MNTPEKTSKLRLAFIALYFETLGVGGGWPEDTTDEQKDEVREALATFLTDAELENVMAMLGSESIDDFDDEVEFVSKARKMR